MDSLELLNHDIVNCFRCPRLVEWREFVARTKKREFADEEYWGRPVPNWGDPRAGRLIVGLAPAAHGGNRTGRIFTGDRSGDFLFAALFRAGVANQPESRHVADGLQLKGVLITAPVHCAPPGNKPLPSELGNCREYLARTLALRRWTSILCLGKIAWDQLHVTLGERPQVPFGHGAVSATPTGTKIIGSYHVSQQNTFTGKLTPSMMDEVLELFLRSE
ncbi:MAG TPA: uracil-DNA glycosylase [Fimbriimonadaceae bacterium]|nr:uracil-DNA glycosylase [Fimbriimonadaceae bacterium]